MKLTQQQEAQYEELRRAKERVEDSFIGRNGVVGMGVGFKERTGAQTDELAIRFYVKDKRAIENAGVLPATIEGHPVAIIEADFQPNAQTELADEVEQAPEVGPDKGRYNPLLGGISIAPSRLEGSAGTLGILVKDGGGTDVMMLSNYHVMCLADGNAKKDDEICQEARSDNAFGWCGNCSKLVCWRVENVKIDGVSYGIDAAVAKLTARKASIGSIEGIGKVSGAGKAKVCMSVWKRGRTTRLTSGVVEDVVAAVVEDFGAGIGEVILRNQIIVVGEREGEKFTQGGDSGSVYVDKATKAVVALHWGGTTGGRSVGSPIAAVLNALNVTISTEEDAGGRPDSSTDPLQVTQSGVQDGS